MGSRPTKAQMILLEKLSAEGRFLKQWATGGVWSIVGEDGSNIGLVHATPARLLFERGLIDWVDRVRGGDLYTLNVAGREALAASEPTT